MTREAGRTFRGAMRLRLLAHAKDKAAFGRLVAFMFAERLRKGDGAPRVAPIQSLIESASEIVVITPELPSPRRLA